MSLDPAITNSDHCVVVLENERVRVLQHTDAHGDRTTPQDHPDSALHTLSSFRRRLHAADGTTRDMQMPAGTIGWLPAQQHAGHDIGESTTHVIFVELEEGPPAPVAGTASLGPTGAPAS